jgi:hypothetical protein
MILGMSLLPQGISASALKIDRGVIKEEQVYTREKVAADIEEVFFNNILHAPGTKGRSVFLILGFLAQKGHGPIQMMKRKIFNTVNAIITTPFIAIPIRTGNKQAMKNRQEDGPLYIKLELSIF